MPLPASAKSGFFALGLALASGCFESQPVSRPPTSTDSGGCAGGNLSGTFAGGSGSQSDPFRICTAEQFLNLGRETTRGRYFQIDADLNFMGVTWRPVASFGGVIDGKNHVLRNIGYISTVFAGVFGSLESNAIIRNLRLEDVLMVGHENVGGLVGAGRFSRIENVTAIRAVVRGDTFSGGLIGACDRCEVFGVRVSGTVAGGDFTGGIAGGFRGTMDDAHFSGEVSGTSGYIGGVVGYLPESSASNLRAFSDVSSPSDRVGGVVGSMLNSTVIQAGSVGDISGLGGVGGVIGEAAGSSSRLVRGFSRGTVTGAGFIAGGIAGYNQGLVMDSYHQGDVASAGNPWVSGGVAFLDAGGIVANLYAVGNVTGTANVGGVVGGSAGVISNCYWNSDVYPGNNGLGSPLNTAQMGVAANFTTWDFADVWELGLVFPALQWE